MTHSTIPPSQNQRLSLTKGSWLLDRRKDTTERKVSIHFLVCKGLSIDDVGVSGDSVFQEIRPGAGFETADFVKEKLGGATVVRLLLFRVFFVILLGRGIFHPVYQFRFFFKSVF